MERNKRVIGCDLDVSYIIENKRTRVSCNEYAVNTSLQKISKHSHKKNKREDTRRSKVYDCIKSGQSDKNRFFGFVSTENEKLKHQYFMKLLEKMKADLLKIRNKNHELTSKVKDVYVDIHRLDTGLNYKVWCLIHEVYNCECIQASLKNNNVANSEKEQIHKDEQNFSVKSSSSKSEKQNIIKYGEYPINLCHTIDNPIPHLMWRIEIVQDVFTEIVNTVTKHSLSYDDIIQSHRMSVKLQKSVRLSLTNRYFTFGDCYGIYVSPKENCYVYFGPYSLVEDHCLKVYKKMDKKKVEVPFKNIGKFNTDPAYKIVNMEALPNATNSVEPLKGMWCRCNCDDSLGDSGKGPLSRVGLMGSEMINVCVKDKSKHQSYENRCNSIKNILLQNKETIRNLASNEDLYSEECESLVESEPLKFVKQGANSVTEATNKQHLVSILKSNCKLNNAKQNQLSTNISTSVLKTTFDQEKEVVVKRNTETCNTLKIYEANDIEFCIHKKERLFNGDVKNLRNGSLPRQLFSNISSDNKVLPKMVFLCCTPGIGYIPILEYDETKIVFEDPVNENKLHQFTNVLQASIWLDNYFKSQIQFEENVNLTWRVIRGCTKRLFPLDQRLFTDPTLIVTARGVADFPHNKTPLEQPGNQ